MQRAPLSDLQWNLGTVAKMSLGGDDFVEADDSAYVTIDDAEGAVCEINIEGQHAREAALLTVSAPKLLAVVRQLIDAVDAKQLQMNSPEIGEPENDIPLHPWHEELLHYARAAVALAEGRP